MQALALIGSPRKGGNTDCLADAFLEGAVTAGATVGKIYLDDLHIRPIAEVGDHFPTRVDLRADDDWTRTMHRLVAADVIAWGAPVYWQGVPAQMKCLVDRWSAHYAGDWLNQGLAGQAWAVLCPYGAPDRDESHWVVDPIKAWTRRWRCRYAGDVCVSVARKGAVQEMSDVLERTRDLGRRAVGLGRNR